MPELSERLAAAARIGNLEFQPRLLHLDGAADREALAALFDSGRIVACHDTIHEQVAQLIRTEHPDRRFDPAELAERTTARLGSQAHHYGTWVFYPWSGRLVHLLPPAEFRALRADRNHYKISPAEQARLRAASVGVIGLSVGRSAAMTLALEGVGGRFRLADFDHLELSNLNRLQCGLHDLGLPKTVSVARAMFELDPYLSIELFHDGITAENLDAFLTGDGRLDVVAEECDDLFVKVRVRERCRALGIPVVMETSDRGMLDVERFDREPDRPPFHGLVGDLRAESLVGLSTKEKVPFIIRILDVDRLSPRMLATLPEIETSVSTWPQLGSDVVLGGALVTHACRRILTGEPLASGRFYVDLDELLAPSAAVAVAPPPPEQRAAVAEATREPSLPSLSPVGVDPARLTGAQVRALVAWAAQAPSAGNAQPWRFAFREGALHLGTDPARARSGLDFEDRATRMALGAVAENLALAAGGMGLAATIEATGELAWTFRFARAATEPSPLLAQIPRRVTNRRVGPGTPLPAADLAPLQQAAASAGGHLALRTDRATLDAVAALIGEADRVQWLDPAVHREVMAELRWTPEAVLRSRDGLDLATLELAEADRAGLRVIARPDVMATMARLGTGAGLGALSRQWMRSAGAVGLVVQPDGGAGAYFEGGRVAQRVWLAATAAGLALHPMTALPYLLARLAEAPETLAAWQHEALARVRESFRALFPDLPAGEHILLFRLFRADPPSARSLRRPVDEVLTLHD